MPSIAARADGFVADMFQVISPGASSVAAIGAASVALAQPTAGVTILRLFATTDCFIAFGATPTAVVEGVASIFLPGGVVEYFEREEGETLAVISSNASTGKLYITEGGTE
jgi:hypothetical protein